MADEIQRPEVGHSSPQAIVRFPDPLKPEIRMQVTQTRQELSGILEMANHDLPQPGEKPQDIDRLRQSSIRTIADLALVDGLSPTLSAHVTAIMRRELGDIGAITPGVGYSPDEIRTNYHKWARADIARSSAEQRWKDLTAAGVPIPDQATPLEIASLYEKHLKERELAAQTAATESLIAQTQDATALVQVREAVAEVAATTPKQGPDAVMQYVNNLLVGNPNIPPGTTLKTLLHTPGIISADQQSQLATHIIQLLRQESIHWTGGSPADAYLEYKSKLKAPKVATKNPEPPAFKAIDSPPPIVRAETEYPEANEEEKTEKLAEKLAQRVRQEGIGCLYGYLPPNWVRPEDGKNYTSGYITSQGFAKSRDVPANAIDPKMGMVAYLGYINSEDNSEVVNSTKRREETWIKNKIPPKEILKVERTVGGFLSKRKEKDTVVVSPGATLDPSYTVIDRNPYTYAGESLPPDSVMFHYAAPIEYWTRESNRGYSVDLVFGVADPLAKELEAAVAQDPRFPKVLIQRLYPNLNFSPVNTVPASERKNTAECIPTVGLLCIDRTKDKNDPNARKTALFSETK